MIWVLFLQEGKRLNILFALERLWIFSLTMRMLKKSLNKVFSWKMQRKNTKMISDKMRSYEQSRFDLQRLFGELGLYYSDDMSEDYKLFNEYKGNFKRTKFKSRSDLAYLIRASHSLAEEIKVCDYLRSQSETTPSRKGRTEKLLSLLGAIVAENPQYSVEVETISNMINGIEKDRIILSLADYDESIKKINEEKKNVDDEINKLQGQAS